MLETGPSPRRRKRRRHDDLDAALRMVYRVTEEGMIAADNDLVLLDRPHPEWTVARVIGLLIAGDPRHDRAALATLAALAALAENWRKRATKMSAR
jgi:MOSC domain-containing protein YiiM